MKKEDAAMLFDMAKWFFPAVCIISFLPIITPGLYLGIFAILDTVLFFFCIRYKDDWKKDFLIYRIKLTVFAALIPVYIAKRAADGGTNIIIALPVMGMLVFGLAIGLALFTGNEKKKEFMTNYMAKMAVQDTALDSGEGVKLCIDHETGQEVWQDPKSRYVHTLVIGPTGCGKTSTMLIPMVWQDVQKGHGITVIEPKGDFAEKVYAMCVETKQPVIYFNPIMPDCPYFNPLEGPEDEVIETITTVFTMLTPDSATYFKDMADNLIRKSLMTLKRIETAYTNSDTGISSRPATLIALSDLIHNTDGKGRAWVKELSELPTLTAAEKKQNQDTKEWFYNEYFADRSKVYENTSGIRTQVAKLIQNKYLRRVLNPEDGKGQINFDTHLANGGRIVISTAQGMLRELSSYLGYFLIFTLQSSIFRRPGNENTRTPNFLYIDEAQNYLNPGFSDILTQGRSYRVSVVMASQSRLGLVLKSGNEAKNFLNVIDTNCRSIVIFPGISAEDAKFYSDTFGEVKRMQERIGESKQKFNIAMGFKDMNYPTESHQYQEVTEAEHSTSDLIYKGFKNITYRIIAHDEVQRARLGDVEWIPKELNDRLENIVNAYVADQMRKRQEAELANEEKRREIYREFQNNPKAAAAASEYSGKQGAKPTGRGRSQPAFNSALK